MLAKRGGKDGFRLRRDSSGDHRQRQRRYRQREQALNEPLSRCPVWRRMRCSFPYRVMTCAELLERFAELFGEERDRDERGRYC